MQPAEHLCPSGFRVSGPPRPRGGRGGQTCIKTFPGQVGMCVQNFIKIGAGVWISISPPRVSTDLRPAQSVRTCLGTQAYILYFDIVKQELSDQVRWGIKRKKRCCVIK